MNNYYTILGIQKGYDAESLKKAYRQKAKLCHPDLNHGNQKATAEFKKLNEAYEFLKDKLENPEEEIIYDFNAGSSDALYATALALVLKEGHVGTAFIQRHLKIGYNQARLFIERMEKEGFVSAPDHAGRRKVYGHAGQQHHQQKKPENLGHAAYEAQENQRAYQATRKEPLKTITALGFVLGFFLLLVNVFLGLVALLAVLCVYCGLVYKLTTAAISELITIHNNYTAFTKQKENKLSEFRHLRKTRMNRYDERSYEGKTANLTMDRLNSSLASERALFQRMARPFNFLLAFRYAFCLYGIAMVLCAVVPSYTHYRAQPSAMLGYLPFYCLVLGGIIVSFSGLSMDNIKAKLVKNDKQKYEVKFTLFPVILGSIGCMFALQALLNPVPVTSDPGLGGPSIAVQSPAPVTPPNNETYASEKEKLKSLSAQPVPDIILAKPSQGFATSAISLLQEPVSGSKHLRKIQNGQEMTIIGNSSDGEWVMVKLVGGAKNKQRTGYVRAENIARFSN